MLVDTTTTATKTTTVKLLACDWRSPELPQHHQQPKPQTPACVRRLYVSVSECDEIIIPNEIIQRNVFEFIITIWHIILKDLTRLTLNLLKHDVWSERARAFAIGNFDFEFSETIPYRLGLFRCCINHMLKPRRFGILWFKYPTFVRLKYISIVVVVFNGPFFR